MDIEKLLAQLERSEKARLATEARMIELKGENGKLTEKNIKNSQLIKSLNADIKDNNEKLKQTEESLHFVTVSCITAIDTLIVVNVVFVCVGEIEAVPYRTD